MGSCLELTAVKTLVSFPVWKPFPKGGVFKLLYKLSPWQPELSGKMQQKWLKPQHKTKKTLLFNTPVITGANLLFGV